MLATCSSYVHAVTQTSDNFSTRLLIPISQNEAIVSKLSVLIGFNLKKFAFDDIFLYFYPILRLSL